MLCPSEDFRREAGPILGGARFDSEFPSSFGAEVDLKHGR